jgi:SAM-dependent methyltransferase
MPPGSALHHAAAQGFAAGAATYEKGRPDFPRGVTGWLSGALGLGPGKVAVDLGAGTGKFTPRLLETRAEVIAVEPVAAMRDRLVARLPAVRALEGTAEAIPLADGSVDAVICAQAFHWFASSAALAEIHRVLRPGGSLGLIWNVRDESVPWVAAITDIIRPYEGDAPRYASGAWRLLFPADGFSPLDEVHFANPHVGPAEAVIVDRTLSISFIAALPAEEREAVATEVRALIAATPDLASRDTVAFPYDTAAFSCCTL